MANDLVTPAPIKPSQQPLGRKKTLAGLIVSLLLPPIGLVLGLWLFYRGRKLQQKRLTSLGLLTIVLALIGAAAYGIYYNNRDKADPVGPIVATTDEYPQTDLIVCLDNKFSVLITKDSPFKFDPGDSGASGTISLPLARHILDKTNGDFEIGVGPEKGKHHFDEGACPSQQL